MGVEIKSWGHFIPDHRVTNAELAARFAITEEWILARTGIEERRYFMEGPTSDMIIRAAVPCLEQANMTPGDLDCVLVATMTPDYHCPSTASIVHHKLGAHKAYGFDIMAACSGYIYALQVATALINAGTHNNVLICAADKFSSIIDYNDRKTRLIFGDGAGVCLLQHSSTVNQVTDTICKMDSTNHMDIVMKAGGSLEPSTAEAVEKGNHYFRFFSKSIGTSGVSLFKNIILELLGKHGLNFDDITYIVPHQANKRMIEQLADALGLPVSRFIINIEHIGNTSAATIPLAISQALQNGALRRGQKLLLTSVGAGYTYAASLITL